MAEFAEFAPFIKSDRRLNYGLATFAGMLLIAAGGSLTIPGDELVGKIVLVGLLGGLGMVFGGMAIRSLTRPHPGVEVLRHRPQDVAWISPTKNFHEGGHISTIFVLHLHDGTKVRVHTPPRIEAEAVRILKARCPHADYGYSPELAAKHAKASHGAGADAWAPVPSGDAAIEPLLRALVKSDRSLLWVGIPCVVIAGLLVALFIAGSDSIPRGLIVVAGVVAVVLTLIGALVLRVALRPAHRHPVVKALRGEGSSIESISLRYISYSSGSDVMPQLRVGTTRRKLHMVLLPPGTEKPLLAELRRRFPHAFEGVVVSEMMNSM